MEASNFDVYRPRLGSRVAKALMSGNRPRIESIQIHPLAPDVDPDFVTEDSDLGRLDRNVVIVTTASLRVAQGCFTGRCQRGSQIFTRGGRRTPLELETVAREERRPDRHAVSNSERAGEDDDPRESQSSS